MFDSLQPGRVHRGTADEVEARARDLGLAVPPSGYKWQMWNKSGEGYKQSTGWACGVLCAEAALRLFHNGQLAST